VALVQNMLRVRELAYVEPCELRHDIAYVRIWLVYAAYPLAAKKSRKHDLIVQLDDLLHL
jgi:hypothetical protein